jgi:hypothetical protein
MAIPARRVVVALVSVLAALGVACGGKEQRPVFPVSGKVFFQKKPAAKALVIFTPIKDTDPKLWPQGYPRGTVAEDGSFQLTSYKTDDGAPAGEYAVTVKWMLPLPGKEEEADKLDGKYADPKNPVLRFEVKENSEGMTVPPIHLD